MRYPHDGAIVTLSREALGRAIADVRTSLGITQEALGEETGLGQTAVSRLESGSRRVEATELLRIAEALNVDVSELFSRAKVLDDLPFEDDVTFEVVGLRIEKSDPQVADALRWIGPFLERFDRLEDLIHGG